MAQFTKYTGTITGANGTLITALDAALVTGQGWTKAYTGANKAAYQQAGGNQFYLRVQDDGPGAGGAKEARITGYETMSDVDTGTGPFPTAAQGVGSVAMVVVRKSADAGTARNYKLWADDRTVMFFCESEGTAGQWFAFMFGDFYSYVASDGYRTCICGRLTENSTATTAERIVYMGTAVSSAGSGLFVARGYSGSGGSVVTGRFSDVAGLNSGLSIGLIPFPNPADGGLYVAPLRLNDTVTAPANHVRGHLRGFWVPCHPVGSYNDGDTFSGVGELSGKTFEIVKSVYNSSNACVISIETSNTLDTN